jgi:hypothetical protein
LTATTSGKVVLTSFLDVRQMGRDIVLRNRLNRELPAPLHLYTIDTDILNIIVIPVVGVAADHASLVEVEATVAAVEPE